MTDKPREPSARERARLRRSQRAASEPQNVVPIERKQRSKPDTREEYDPWSPYTRGGKLRKPPCPDHKKVDPKLPCPTCGKCVGHSSRAKGRPCRKYAIPGGSVCLTHGGSAEQVRKAARLRLLELVDPAIAQLGMIVMKGDTSDADRARAIQMILDRTGFGPGSKLEVDDRKWQGVAARVVRPTGEDTRSRYADRHYDEGDEE